MQARSRSTPQILRYGRTCGIKGLTLSIFWRFLDVCAVLYHCARSMLRVLSENDVISSLLSPIGIVIG
jgi:hypothetical protein